MAGMVGSSASGVFSAAISQSPVTSWYYYGERAFLEDFSLSLLLPLSLSPPFRFSLHRALYGPATEQQRSL